MNRQHAIALIKIAAQRAGGDFDKFDQAKLKIAVDKLIAGFDIPISLQVAMG